MEFEDLDEEIINPTFIPSFYEEGIGGEGEGGEGDGSCNKNNGEEDNFIYGYCDCCGGENFLSSLTTSGIYLCYRCEIETAYNDSDDDTVEKKNYFCTRCERRIYRKRNEMVEDLDGNIVLNEWIEEGDTPFCEGTCNPSYKLHNALLLLKNF